MFCRCIFFLITGMLVAGCGSDSSDSAESDDMGSDIDSETNSGNNIRSTDSATGPDDASGTYELTVSWTLAGVNTCRFIWPEVLTPDGELTLGNVELNFYQDNTRQNTVHDPVSVPCSETETTVALPWDGTCYVTAIAYADYQGAPQPFFEGAIQVDGPGTENRVAVPLQLVDGDIHVYWQFEGGKICGIEMSGEVATVEVSLNGGEPTVSSCGAGQLTLGNIAPGSVNTISAVALDANGTVLSTVEYVDPSNRSEFVVLPGQTYQVIMRFQ